MGAMEKILNLPQESIGVIGEGRRELGEKVTLGLVQSLIKIDLQSLRDYFGTIIVDEAHRVPCKTFKEIVEHTASKYRFGLTATPKRRDGLESILYYVMGPVIYRITERDLLERGEIMIPKIIRVSTPFQATKREPYHSLIEEMIKNRSRNQCILEVLMKTIKRGDTALILSSRVEHCKVLKRLLDKASSLRTAVLTGETPKRERKEIIEKTKEREIELVIATKIADEGLDMPHLNRLYLVTPFKSKTKIKQQLGRVMRISKDKKEALVFDFVDQEIPLLRRQFSIRGLVYHQLGCTIENL